MESEGEQGRVMISQSTKDFLEIFPLFKFEQKQEPVTIERINLVINAYFVEPIVFLTKE